MKRIKQLVLFYLLLFSSAIFIQSCCDEPDIFTITGEGELLFTEGTVVNPSILTSSFSIYTEPEITISDNWQDLGLMNSALALSCDEEFVNKLDESTIELTLDQEFTLAGETISAGENLMGLEGITFIFSDYDLLITFEQDFIDNVVMTPGAYEFSLQMSTDDEVELKSTATVDIDL